jgi:UDP-N-acetylglucosamine 2-epimerase
VRIVIAGEREPPGALAEALEAAGIGFERPAASALGATHGNQVAELAAALIEFERLLAEDPPDAVLLISASNPALAAVLVAAKLQIPVAAMVDATPRDRRSELNRRLIEQLADRTVGDDAATIAASLRDLIGA